MIRKSQFEQFNDLLSSLIVETCEVSNISELNNQHFDQIERVFQCLLGQNKTVIVEEWGIEPEWLNYIANFEHTPSSYIHSTENPFGMSLLRDGAEDYVICPHLHINERVIGGDSLVLGLKDVSLNFAFDQFSYVATRFADSAWQKITEAFMSRNKFLLSNEDYMTGHTQTTLSTNAPEPENDTFAEEGKKKFDDNRLQKYDKSMDNAKVGEIMGAFGEALDEVLNRRDIKPADKEIRSFLGIGAADMSEGEKTFPGFYIPMALLAIDAIIARDFNIVKTTNYENWSRMTKPIGFGMYQTALNHEQRMMHECYQMCELRADPQQKIIVQRAVHQTMSGPQLSVTCLSALKDANLYSSFFDGLRNWIKENNYYKGQKIDASGKFLNVAKYGWDDIVLEAEVKDNVFDDVVGFLNYADLYRANDLPFKKGTDIAW